MTACIATEVTHSVETAPLRQWLAARSQVCVITGAGVSTESGIPDYRDGDGNWKRAAPLQYQDFLANRSVRRRYWARSFAGWPMFRAARPSAAHVALARLQQADKIGAVITQNVDRLHQRAGTHHVIDLHGRLDVVRCLACGQSTDRDAFQARLQAANPAWVTARAPIAPDGDADVEGIDFSAFEVPACACCGGVMKPDVVFYGGSVPRERADAAMAATLAADGVLVVGSSLMVWSSCRLVRAAARRGISVSSVNRGRTRADELMTYKCVGECGAVLTAVAADWTAAPPALEHAAPNAGLPPINSSPRMPTDTDPAPAEISGVLSASVRPKRQEGRADTRLVTRPVRLQPPQHVNADAERDTAANQG
jgi:NAD-dependent SIR2 family protein deacetylase